MLIVSRTVCRKRSFNRSIVKMSATEELARWGTDAPQRKRDDTPPVVLLHDHIPIGHSVALRLPPPWLLHSLPLLRKYRPRRFRQMFRLPSGQPLIRTNCCRMERAPHIVQRCVGCLRKLSVQRLLGSLECVAHAREEGNGVGGACI